MSKKEPEGTLTITVKVAGARGTGKTTAIRHMVAGLCNDFDVDYKPANVIAQDEEATFTAILKHRSGK